MNIIFSSMNRYWRSSVGPRRKNVYTVGGFSRVAREYTLHGRYSINGIVIESYSVQPDLRKIYGESIDPVSVRQQRQMQSSPSPSQQVVSAQLSSVGPHVHADRPSSTSFRRWPRDLLHSVVHAIVAAKIVSRMITIHATIVCPLRQSAQSQLNSGDDDDVRQPRKHGSESQLYTSGANSSMAARRRSATGTNYVSRISLVITRARVGRFVH